MPIFTRWVQAVNPQGSLLPLSTVLAWHPRPVTQEQVCPSPGHCPSGELEQVYLLSDLQASHVSGCGRLQGALDEKMHPSPGGSSVG